jgi:hypothetical protein
VIGRAVEPRQRLGRRTAEGGKPERRGLTARGADGERCFPGKRGFVESKPQDRASDDEFD